MAIRYDKKLNSEINRVIRNFNSKVRRLERETNNLVIPSKVKTKDIKQSYSTRKDLRRKLKELESFSKRGAEDLFVTTQGFETNKWTIANLKKESARLKRQLTRDINYLKLNKPKVLGSLQTATFAQMGDTSFLNLVAKREALNKDITKLSKEEMSRYSNLIQKSFKNKDYMNNIFKDNYLKMLTDLGYHFNLGDKKLDLLKSRLKDLKPNDFLKLFTEDKSIRAILDYYPIITDTLSGINPDDIKEDVNNLYDALIENLDDILKDYE